ncbi:FT-interacting protein 1, partial [Mucuna pruriens]
MIKDNDPHAQEPKDVVMINRDDDLKPQINLEIMCIFCNLLLLLLLLYSNFDMVAKTLRIVGAESFTVITIAVFDNCELDANSRVRGARDATMGKIRIRLSTLDNDKVHKHCYPLVGLQPSWVKKIGEIHLAVRFSWLFPLAMCQSYMSPLLPRHHHDFPLNQPALIIPQRLSRAEPPLREEVVYYMLDFRPSMWSKRKQGHSLIGDFVAFWKWLEDIRNWKKPFTTLLFNFVCFLMILFYQKRIFPLVILFLLCVVLKRYLKRPRHLCHTDATLCGADVATPEDIEELDMFPTQLGGEPLTRRYDRLTIVATNAQKLANGLATLGEMLQAVTC